MPRGRLNQAPGPAEAEGTAGRLTQARSAALGAGLALMRSTSLKGSRVSVTQRLLSARRHQLRLILVQDVLKLRYP